MTKHEQTSSKQKLREIESRLVAVLTSMGYLKGRSQKMAEIAAYITIRKEITQKSLRELTGYSLGTVSSNVQSLEIMGFVNKFRDSNSREYIYRYDESFTKSGSRSIMNVFEYLSQLQKFLSRIEVKLDKPHLVNKNGYENVKDFVNSTKSLFPAVQRTLQKISSSSKIQMGRDK